MVESSSMLSLTSEEKKYRKKYSHLVKSSSFEKSYVYCWRPSALNYSVVTYLSHTQHSLVRALRSSSFLSALSPRIVESGKSTQVLLSYLPCRPPFWFLFITLPFAWRPQAQTRSKSVALGTHASQCEWDILLLWKAALVSTPHTTKAIQDTRLSTHTSLSAVTSPPWLVHSRPLLMPRNSKCGFVSHFCLALCTRPLNALSLSHTGFTHRLLLCLFFLFKL